MIREFQKSDTQAVMELWLQTNCSAHHFIDPSYWQNRQDEVRYMLPQASVFVYERQGAIQGFIGLMDEYIAGIFVSGGCQGKGIGKQLLDFVKEAHSELTLHVYEKNERAVGFYVREGFYTESRQSDDSTGEAELTMRWTK